MNPWISGQTAYSAAPPKAPIAQMSSGAVGQLAQRHGQEEGDGAREVRPRPTWAADSPTIWVKKTATGEERALADREQHRPER
ncbi:MAG: hypothetical protein M3237_03450 [Actinomycetota bacterium]|nr:hypothetical protein [Actinomycetota bacterium]